MYHQTQNHGPLIPRIWHELIRTFRGEPHSLHEIQDSLRDAEFIETDFMYLLKQHHDFMFESIEIINDKYTEDFEKQWQLERFLHLLSMHSRAEQETLYRKLSMTEDKEAFLMSASGSEEHALALTLSEELYRLNFQDRWTDTIEAKAKVLTLLVSAHIKEEESVIFPLVERCLEENEISDLLSSYINKCEGYLEIEMQPGFHL